MQRRRSESSRRIHAVEETGTGAVIEILGAGAGSGKRRVSTTSRPDRETARRLLGCNLRADWVVLGPGGSGVLCVRAHRVPRRVRVSLPVALGLAEVGVPAYLSGASA